MGAGARQFGFMVRGLQLMQPKLEALNIPFFLLKGEPVHAVVTGLYRVPMLPCTPLHTRRPVCPCDDAPDVPSCPPASLLPSPQPLVTHPPTHLQATPRRPCPAWWLTPVPRCWSPTLGRCAWGGSGARA